FPSVAVLDSGQEMLATYVRAEAFEAVNMRVYLARSCNGGRSWQQEGPLPTGVGNQPWSETARLTCTPQGELIVLLTRFDRSAHLEEGLCNPQTMGLAPMRFLTLRSQDGGRTWSSPEPIQPPLRGPEFELCAPITCLSDGRWLLPTSTWRSWEGELPNGNRMVAFASQDHGRTWPSYLNVMTSPDNRLIFW